MTPNLSREDVLSQTIREALNKFDAFNEKTRAFSPLSSEYFEMLMFIKQMVLLGAALCQKDEPVYDDFAI